MTKTSNQEWVTQNVVNHLAEKSVKGLKASWACTIHSKKCWVVLTQLWVKYGQTRNVGLKM